MIISDTQKIAFVHIPKCGGQTLRNVLRSLQDTKELRGVMDKGVGTFDYSHLTLKQLRQYEPAFFNALHHYESFCIVRDPYKRVPSALRQRYQMYLGKDLQEDSQDDIIRELEQAERHLATGEMPHDFVHFTPQSDFISLEGENLVRKIADLRQLGEVFEWLKTSYGAVVEQETKNKAKVPSSKAARFYIKTVKPMVGKGLISATPSWVKKAIRDVTLTEDYSADLIPTELINSIVEKNYQKDLELFEQASSDSFFNRYPETRPPHVA